MCVFPNRELVRDGKRKGDRIQLMLTWSRLTITNKQVLPPLERMVRVAGTFACASFKNYQDR